MRVKLSKVQREYLELLRRIQVDRRPHEVDDKLRCRLEGMGLVTENRHGSLTLTEAGELQADRVRRARERRSRRGRGPIT